MTATRSTRSPGTPHSFQPGLFSCPAQRAVPRRSAHIRDGPDPPHRRERICGRPKGKYLERLPAERLGALFLTLSSTVCPSSSVDSASDALTRLSDDPLCCWRLP